MDIISQLSSEIGDKTEESNRKVAEYCLAHPASLQDIAKHLSSSDVAIIGDCAEIFTKVAESNPALIVPYTNQLLSLLMHKNTRVRWEVTHAIGLIAHMIPDQVKPLLSQFQRMALSDTSTIVRDNSVVVICNYAKSSINAAHETLPLLKRILEVWGEKQAARILKGLQNIVEIDSNLADEIYILARMYEKSPRGVVRKAAVILLRTVENMR